MHDEALLKRDDAEGLRFYGIEFGKPYSGKAKHRQCSGAFQANDDETDAALCNDNTDT
jgi:hypothetical protein